MGTKIKYILAIVFFPIVIIFFLTKRILKKIELKILKKFLNQVTIENIDALSGIEFEELLFSVFSAKGYKVIKTKKSHDYGADLIVMKKDIKIAIQCKLYYKHSVGNSAVQEISSAKDYYNADIGVVITNSVFSKPAIILAQKIGIKLIDRSQLCTLIKTNKEDFINT